MRDPPRGIEDLEEDIGQLFVMGLHADFTKGDGEVEVGLKK